jgi:hypothetical protein
LPRLPRWLPFEWIVAIRFLREGRLQTAFIIGGIAIGVGVIVFMSALLTGLQANFVRRALTGQAHIQLLPPKETVRALRDVPAEGGPGNGGAIVQAPLQRVRSIDQWQAIAAQIRALPEVLVVSPAVTGPALAVRGDASRSISVIGMEPELYYRIVPLDEKVVRGSAGLSGSDILIGTELASDLGIGVGDKLRITAATGAANTLTIAGVFDLGNKGANTRSTFVTLRTAQSLLGLPGGVSVLDVTVRDVLPPRPLRSASPPPPACRPTAGSRPTSSSSAPSTRRHWPTGRSASSSRCRWPSASPACWWCRWCRNRARSASCGRWASRAGRSCACSCCRAGCWGWAARWPDRGWARSRWRYGSASRVAPTVSRCSC